jgi:hypothetical protein
VCPSGGTSYLPYGSQTLPQICGEFGAGKKIPFPPPAGANVSAFIIINIIIIIII